MPQVLEGDLPALLTMSEPISCFCISLIWSTLHHESKDLASDLSHSTYQDHGVGVRVGVAHLSYTQRWPCSSLRCQPLAWAGYLDMGLSPPILTLHLISFLGLGSMD